MYGVRSQELFKSFEEINSIACNIRIDYCHEEIGVKIHVVVHKASMFHFHLQASASA